MDGYTGPGLRGTRVYCPLVVHTLRPNGSAACFSHSSKYPASSIRPAWPLFTACFVYLLRNAATTTTDDSDEADGPTFDLISAPFRPETNASAALTFQKARNSAVEEADHELQNNEERGRKDLLRPVVDAIIKKYGHPAKFVKKITVRVGQVNHIDTERLQKWIRRADKYHARVNTFDDAAVVKLLEKSIGGTQQLVKALQRLEGTPMRYRARTLQIVLAEKISPEGIFSLWLAAGIDPEEAYLIPLPIATEDKHMTSATSPGQLTHGVKDATTLPATHPNFFLRWVEYVVQYISDNRHFNEGDVYDV